MASNDPPKTNSISGSESKTHPPDDSTASSPKTLATEAKPKVAAPGVTSPVKPAPETLPTASDPGPKTRPSQPVTEDSPDPSQGSAESTSTSGIDAMAILGKAEADRRAEEVARANPNRSIPHQSAAQAIAKAAAREHPQRVSRPPPQPEPRKLQLRPVVDTVLPVEPTEPIAGVSDQGLPPPMVDDGEVAGLLNAEHRDPFSFLGMHQAGVKAAPIVRVFLPDATQVQIIDANSGAIVAELQRVHDEGLFVGQIPGRNQPFPYRLRVTTEQSTLDMEDPYRFPPILTQADAQMLARGEHWTSYRLLGAHPMEIQGVKGCSFAVWAPHASHVSVVGDFNAWDGRRHGMRLRHECGVWEMFLPGVSNGALYKYEIKTQPGIDPQIKSDPYAFFVEQPPGLAPIVHGREFSWQDQTWIETRKQQRRPMDAPFCFYQIHLGSWRRKPEEDHRQLSYRELADELVNYVADLRFTHVALLPVSEHTYDDTVGYLPSALYAPTSRFGNPDDFRYLVDACHRQNIGVVVDWVPSYLSEEPQGLVNFDGTPLYERVDPLYGRDQDWNTPLYDLSRPQVVNYLLANALYWIDQFHLDGLRIDGLAKMLYLDYGRGPGEWLPNKDGGNDNLEALDFVRRFTELMAKHHPDILTIAQDSSLRQGLTRALSEGGMGFSLRWNSAWAYDTLRYLGRHPVHRKYYQFELTNPLIYAFDENFVLPVSHEHVSIGRGSMINKASGDRWQKFATLRAWYALMYALPGKKLMFMGSEFAQDREWNSTISLDWHLLDDPMHLGVQRMIRDLNGLYQEQPALHEYDADGQGFQWIDFQDEDNSVIVFVRYGKNKERPVVVVTHFTPVIRHNYRIGVPMGGYYKEILNTDAEAYGGGNVGSAGGATADFHFAHGQEHSICLTLPPYGTVMLERQ